MNFQLLSQSGDRPWCTEPESCDLPPMIWQSCDLQDDTIFIT